MAWSWTLSATSLPFTYVKNLYKDGEFEKIQTILEHFLKHSGKTAETKEKIFAYRYLGVIYATEPEGYPLAETYFYQLLKLAPNAHLSDLYVSTAVEEVFAKAQLRYQIESRNITEIDEFGNPRITKPRGDTAASLKKDSIAVQPMPSRQTNPQPSKNPQPKIGAKPRIWPWVLGVGVVGAVGGYYWYSTRDKKAGNEIVDTRPP